ncbi:hypothetical protein HY495_02780 [Candidatus Woesearchaeota archaeon]|nr:hypothetical protein [Candidatus Woesearchaeota archaeon]
MEQLERLGLNRNEAKIYLALLDLGDAQAGQISKKTQINRTTTYDSVERLIQRGLVVYVIKANKKVFRPVPPQKILEKIKEEEKIAQDILPELEARFKQNKEKEDSNIYKGHLGIKSILNDILSFTEYVAFGSSGKFLELMKHDFVQFQKQKKEKKIKARVILSKSSKTSESVKLAYTNFRFIPDEFSSPTTTFVYGENTAVIIWSTTPIATVIKSKQVAQSYLNYFKLLWKKTKP